jgi:hypothetical protein
MRPGRDASGRVGLDLRRKGPLARAIEGVVASPALRFGVDTFAFQNDSRVHHRGKPDLFASYCFVMARAVNQFLRFARFDPAGARLSSDEYTARMRAVLRHRAWRPPLAPEQRVVIPGFTGLHELSRLEEPAVKRGLGPRFWTWVHWTNWRIVHPSWPGQQERVAAASVRELQAGRPVQLLLSDFPAITVDHSVLVFDCRPTADDSVELCCYDPNDPTRPGTIRYDRQARRFRVVDLCGVSAPFVRAFRIYCSPLL